METLKFLFMQVTAALISVVAVFVLGLAFGAGVWVAWRALDRRAARVKTPPGSADDPLRQEPL
jgi:membrane protein DedA with SNARE-associated domain